MAILEKSAPEKFPPGHTREIEYTPPAEVFEYWYNRALAEFPGERPALEWLAQKSKLPFSTCGWYRKRYEAAFPDAFALALRGKHLRLSKKWLKRRLVSNIRVFPPDASCKPPPSVQ